jgi:NADPH:quinone reductase-like Zn-dependent oxidoreductase/surfactin synthase thioesterase subunit/ubiquinone/menaquinone biosynthesis C-methylase UbiE/aryl carrier-like protein
LNYPIIPGNVSDIGWNPKESGTVLWNLELDPRTHPYIEDHRVQGPLVYPGAGHVDLALGVARKSFGDDFGFLEDLQFMDPLFLPDEGEPYPAQINVTADEGDYVISTRRSRNEQDWTTHSKGRINHIGDAFCHQPIDLKKLRKKIRKPVKVAPLFELLKNGGLLLGPTFKGLTKLWHSEGESLGRIEIHEHIRHDFQQYNIHPALLDASFQTAFGIIAGTDYEGVYIPIKIKRVKFYKTPKSTIFSYAKAASYTDDIISADIWIMDKNGDLLLEIQGFTAKYLKGSRGEVQGQLDDFFYAEHWLRKDRDDVITSRKQGEFSPRPEALQKPLNNVIKQIQNQRVFKQFKDEFSPVIENIALGYMIEAVNEVGLNSIKISSEHLNLFNRIVEHLKENKIIKKVKGEYIITKAVLPDTHNLMEEAQRKFTKFSPELSLLKLCGPELAQIMKKKKDPIELLFAEKERHLLTDYYANSYTFDRYHQLIAKGIEKFIAKIPEHHTLRVLEIGGGTGGITRMILPLFPVDRTEYFFTDISYEFIHPARKSFSEYSFVEYCAFDINKSIEKQDLIPGSYDLIIASNVIHSTPDVVKSLRTAKKLLADGGTFMMLEVTHTSMYPDLIFGLTEGWWNYLKDPCPREKCTLKSDQWQQALKKAGFEETLAISDSKENNTCYPIQHVFVSRAGTKDTVDKITTREKGTWAVIPDKKGISDKISDKLTKTGHHVEEISTTDFVNLAKFNPVNLPFKGVIYTAGMDLPELKGLSDNNIKQYSKKYIYPLMEVARNLEKNLHAVSLDLWVITSGSHKVGENDKLSIQQTPLIGLGRVISNEIRSFNTHLIDFSTKIMGAEIDQLIGEMNAPVADLTEEEIAFRGKKRSVRRLKRLSLSDRKKASLQNIPASGSSYHIETEMEGLIEELKLTETDIFPLMLDEVAIDVKYSSLNFRDVMLASGSLPEEALTGGIFGKYFGLECSGVITKIGKAVKDFKIGDRVMAIARDCLAGKVYAKGDFTIKLPKGITLEEGAGLSMAYLTAYYSLEKTARLEAGEKVLIHAASGGVGIAAINISKEIGAEIYATASKKKHSFLRKCGIKHIYDSRSTGFYDRIMKDTEGAGVDVVLNSLSGTLLTQSLKLLAPGGRFIEIGKNDVYSNKRIGLELLADNSSYTVVDIDRLMIQKPALMSKCLQEIFSPRSKIYLRNPQLSKHPFQIEKVANFATALRTMSQGKHLGKIILSMDGEVMVSPQKQLKLDTQGSYLVAGGTGGFGLAVGKFLAKKGAGHVVLASRSGKICNKDKKILEEIKSSGAKVSIISADISQRSSVQRLIQKINTKSLPLKGVFQSTMVLADGLLEDMDWQQFSVPFESKREGTWNLHLATQKLKLDYFVSFSSIASLYGTPGQANYAAANSFLDSFAHFRRSKALPATTINWGAIAEMGYVARNSETRNFLANHGWNPVTLTNVLSGLESTMLEGETQIGIFDVDWSVFAETFPHNATSGRFAHLHNDEERQGSGETEQTGFADQLNSATPGDRENIAHEVLRSMISNILGMSKEKIDVQTPLTRMGIDSLMANQIRSWLTNQAGVPFSMMQIMQGPTLSEITATILESIGSFRDTSKKQASVSPWFQIPKPVKNPRQRLFCFPYMGVGASVYNGWQELLPNDVELVAIQLPGREERIADPPLFDTRVLFKQLGEEIIPLLDVPYAFYGHSFGGNIAMSFATYLNGVHKTIPQHLFIGAAIPPSVANPLETDFEFADKPTNTPVNNKSLTELLRKLGTPESVLKDPQALQKIFPAVRGDLAMSRQRLISKNELLPCPITAFAGEKDAIYSPEMIKQWSFHSKTFRIKKILGEHLFIHGKTSLKELIKIINKSIKENK